MSDKEHKQISEIAELIDVVSTQSGMSVQDSMDFVYNSETLEKYLSSESEMNMDLIKRALLNELHYAIPAEKFSLSGIVADDSSFPYTAPSRCPMAGNNDENNER